MTTALYRRYRPETFAEVIGQEHVTGPLMQALRGGRVNHAYLFSGPRGCGKTTSARILARTLNCHRNTPETPLDTPCGQCPSCVELARGGSGSLDVVEIDAASHGGVDDARDLRERATFAPARDRYKIFIIDEAHMVSSAGFNALLKIVEEPPPHIKFVFATTEPDKVIGTIRSRTHHYPFRLVPPDVLAPYLESLCEAEGVTLGGGVVPLVVRAGGGSVRDSLSVLDQLIAGASGSVVDYDLAVGLLGYTHSSLLDDVVDALAARDGASLFRVVDQLIASGHAPQRFVDDLLERLRDLIVIAVSGDAAGAVLRGQPADQLERMGAQASRLGVAELSRAADLVNAALTEMTGATSPRLHLELLCARLLLPGADEGAAGLAARVERLERGGLTATIPPVAAGHAGAVDDGAGAPVRAQGGGARDGAGLSGAAAARAAWQASRRPKAEPGSVGGGAQPVAQPTAAAGAQPVAQPTAAAGAQPVAQPRAAADTAAPAESARPSGRTAHVEASSPVEGHRPEGLHEDEEMPEPAAQPDVPLTPAPTGPATAAPAEPPLAAQGPAAELVRRRWAEVLANLVHPNARAFFTENAQVMGVEGGVLRLGFPTQTLAEWSDTPERRKTVEDAVYETLGVPVRVQVVVGTGSPRPRDTAPARRTQDDAADPDDPAPAPPRPQAAKGTAPVERRPLSRHEPDDVTSRDVRPSPGAGGAAIDEADAAWLAGVSVYEPPDDEPEPPVDDDLELGGPSPRGPIVPASDPLGVPVGTVGHPSVVPAPAHPAAAPGAGSHQALPTDPTAHPASSPHPTPPISATPAADSSLPGDIKPPGPRGSRRESALEAVQRHALQARARGVTSSSTLPASSASSPDPYDDAATDDPEIASTGLVGVPLAVKILNGTIIDERVDQG